MNPLMTIAALLGILATASASAPAAPSTLGLYVGTSSHDAGHGIYRLALDPATGRFVGPARLVAAALDPEFLAMSADGSHLYASDGARGQQPRPGDGTVDSYAVAGDGSLRPLNRVPCGGDRGTFLSLDPTGENLFAVAYGAATVAVLPVGADGQLLPPTVVVQHQGSSVNRSRQAAAHPHSVTLDPAGRFAFVPDLGCDKIFIYRVDPDRHTLTANDPPFVGTPPGSGPRRICFTADGRFAYAVTEMGNAVLAYRYDATRGVLSPAHDVDLLPRPATAADTGSEIALGAGDRFVYASVRGEDAIVVFGRNAVDGTLTVVGRQSTLGKTPRHFAIDPSGRWLVAANQNSASLKVFAIDPGRGTLSPTGGSADVASATCVLFDRVLRDAGRVSPQR
jgi:6-phosphogluconolactonase